MTSKDLKYLIFCMIGFIAILMLGYFLGFEDATDLAKTRVGELMMEECHLPKSGGACKTYCSVGDRDLYELNVEYKKVEVK